MKSTSCAILAIILATGILQAQAAKKPKTKFCRGKNGIKYKPNESYTEGCTQFMCVKKGKKIKMLSKPVPNCVDGEWSAWSSWSDCTFTCGPATKTRERTCSNPAPTNGGNPCPGLKEQIDECSLPPCGSTTPPPSIGSTTPPPSTDSTTPPPSIGHEENVNVTALQINVDSLNATVGTLQATVQALLSLVTKQETCLADVNSAKCPSSKSGKTSVSDAIMKNKDDIQVHHTGPKFQLKGDTGEEKVTISMDGNEDEFTLSTVWQTFSYPRPSNGSFSVEYHNDNELRNVYIQGHESQVQDLLPHCVYNKAWACGTQNENERCRFLRKGNLAWTGKYTYTLKDGHVSEFK